jgi:predicted component of type VI protein secretion system
MMGKDKKTPITVNDKEYFVEEMTEQQQAMVNHLADLERKMSSAQFNMDQLNVGREAFANMLAQSLENPESKEVSE